MGGRRRPWEWREVSVPVSWGRGNKEPQTGWLNTRHLPSWLRRPDARDRGVGGRVIRSRPPQLLAERWALWRPQGRAPVPVLIFTGIFPARVCVQIVLSIGAPVIPFSTHRDSTPWTNECSQGWARKGPRGARNCLLGPPKARQQSRGASAGAQQVHPKGVLPAHREQVERGRE